MLSSLYFTAGRVQVWTGLNAIRCRYNQTMHLISVLVDQAIATGISPDAWRRGLLRLALAVWLSVAAAPAAAERPDQNDTFGDIDREVQALKQEVLEINRELAQLEQELLYPAEERLVLFLSLAEGAAVELQRLWVELDGKAVVEHRYTGAESDALRRGGVQKPYIGRIEYGEHRLHVSIAGIRGDGQAFRVDGTNNFRKGSGPGYMELALDDDGPAGQPRLMIRRLQP